MRVSRFLQICDRRTDFINGAGVDFQLDREVGLGKLNCRLIGGMSNGMVCLLDGYTDGFGFLVLNMRIYTKWGRSVWWRGGGSESCSLIYLLNLKSECGLGTLSELEHDGLYK